ncbi:MAG: flagellar basal body L-ring protein FlgH [Pirellulales bacterium]|nr:flagellar basal body L-ring protein FlgH [Pirellulales bacterium]
MSIHHWPFLLLATIGAGIFGAMPSTMPVALAQDGGLLHRIPAQTEAAPLTLENSSFLYNRPLPLGGVELKRHTIITVLVDISTQMISEGDYENRKTAKLSAVLSDWIKFDGKSIQAAPQTNGDPKVSGSLNSQFKTEADMEARDSMTFRIAAKIIDIRPNGNLVIEAHRTITNNEEVWQQSLTGVVDRKAIRADRTVKSDDIAELRIDKREIGHVRDGYNRGWFQYMYDKYKPF